MSPTRHRNTRSLRSITHWSWVLLASTAWLLGCGGGAAQPQTPTIAQGKFIDTYVALRQAAVALDSTALDSARAAILRKAGVTDQDMLTFVQVHGPDVAFMKVVWDSVEQRLDKGPLEGIKVH